MARESIQKRLERDRPPRVQLTYDVEVGDALETKELPFVLGVVADLSGHPDGPPTRLKDRRFVQVDRDTFDDVLRGMAPRLRLRVPDRLRDDGASLALELRFDRLEDFEPAGIVGQVEPLRRLLEARDRLADLRNRMAGNDRLEELLDGALRDPGRLQALGMAARAESGGRP